MSHLNYGPIGNCKTAALVSDKGSIDWLCFPNFDSPSVFARIVDEEKGGCFAFEVATQYSVRQKYLEGTNILCTRFFSDEGSFEVLDFMPRYRTNEQRYYLPPEIYRYIRPIHGNPRFSIRYEPKMNYAADDVEHRIWGDFIKSVSTGEKRDTLYLYTSLDKNGVLEKEEFRLEKEEFLLLSYNQKLQPIDIQRVHLEYQRTKVYWLNWNNRSRKFKEYNEEIARSLLTLKLMSFQDSGALVAAITSSIPETIGEERNWDYRFCWIRDASMSINTLIKMGHQGAARRFMNFIKRILHSKSDTFQIMYGLNGERSLREEELPHLSGFENSPPVRIGNAAYSQKQNDSLGYLMDVIYRYYIHFPGTLDEVEDMWEIVKGIVHKVYTDWHMPDQSIWEFRNMEKHFVFSKVMCWVALDRAIRIAEFLHKDYHQQKWKEEARRIREDICKNGWSDKKQSFIQSYGQDEIDCSLLLMETYGFVEADDPRYVQTVRCIKKELFHKGLMYRYKMKDDFGEPSSSFTICTFWLIRALYVIGEKEEALEIFRNLLSYSNHLGLFSEDLDFDTKRPLGNFPQAYSHLALVNTALLFTEERDYSKFIRP